VPFTFTAPDGNGSGASFESDPDFKNIITSRPRGGMKGKGFLLPGQDAPKSTAVTSPPPSSARKQGVPK
jgi:hypothetical protein